MNNRSIVSEVPNSTSRSFAGWAARGIVLLAALLLAVGGLTLLPPLGSQAGAYLAARNLGLAFFLLVLLAIGWSRSLAAVLLATAAIHTADGVADFYFQNWPAAAGSIVVTVLSALAAFYLLRESRRTGAA